MTVAAAIVPQAEFLSEICGDKVNIITLIPAGASAESYEPSTKEMAEFAEAELYFSMGVPAETNSILPHVPEDTEIVYLDREVAKVYKDLTIGSQRDPHIWLSVRRAMEIVKIMTDKLKSADPENAAFYQNNSDSYLNELQKLYEDTTEIFKDKKDGIFIVFHPAFGYFADEYSLKMYALEDHGKEATAKDLTQLMDLAKSKKVDTVFCQAETSVKQATVFAEEIGAEVCILEPLAANYTENMRKMADLIGKAVQN